jgi:hypothetical protein
MKVLGRLPLSLNSAQKAESDRIVLEFDTLQREYDSAIEKYESDWQTGTAEQKHEADLRFCQSLG